ncbi:amidase [Methylobrevis pamukkalensis]|uniref:Glutamyl-tRNA(Gln) amidotransferase subunit A n=1 Tax=Methylobrevis pamukkalensis TaxID=1439726 RepID=A0A1E3GWT9_9HYPH|nr:amidase [Methylobrevis pamukkalensis]ODN68474.1 Glutamyl-tRNA(Gln) amidotransferase subunit A [Methylobrevis pamukkalensis]
MLSVLALLADIEAGRTTRAAIAARIGEAIAEREPELQAFAHLETERLLDGDAAAAAGPLGGLPFGVKDIYDTFDMPTTYGSPIYDGWRPLSDAAVVTMTRRAGGIPVGKTRTTEFAYLQPTVTRNPRHPGHTPGGSSSGSAAAVGAGLLPFAFGTQTAGSMMRPGSFCGVAAVKPSYRLLPAVGMKTFSWNLDTVGLFAATIADCAYVLSAISGRHLRVDGTDCAAPRIGVVRSGFSVEAEPAMCEALETAVRKAEAAGARVTAVDLPAALLDADRVQPTIMEFEGAASLAHEMDRHRGQLSPKLAEALLRGGAIPVETYDAARSTAHAGRRCFETLFSDIDVLLTPSAPGAAPAGLGATGSPAFNRLFTLIGAPTVNVPGLTDPAGLPLGMQLAARFGRDDMALRAGAWLEAVLAD